MVEIMSSSRLPDRSNPTQVGLKNSCDYFNLLLLVGGDQEHPCNCHPAHLRSPWNHDQHSMDENSFDFFHSKEFKKEN